MSIIGSRIQELKTTVVEQNEKITTMKGLEREVRNAVVQIYQGAVKYKVDYAAGSNEIETSTYPEVRAEDVNRVPMPMLLATIGKIFGVVSTSLNENRAELNAIVKEFDAEVDEAMSTWQKLKISDDNDKKAESFRHNLVANASAPRSQTPDLVANQSSMHVGPTLPPTPPQTAGKKEHLEQIQTSQQRSGTTTLEKMLSPTTGARRQAAASANKSNPATANPSTQSTPAKENKTK